MILNLLRVEALKIEEMIKRSFGENTTQALLPTHEIEIAAKEGQLKGLFREPCGICDVDMRDCLQASLDAKIRSEDLIKSAFATPVGRMTFTPGRLLVIQRSVSQNPWMEHYFGEFAKRCLGSNSHLRSHFRGSLHWH